MRQRTRKFFGVIGTFVYLTAYSLIVMALGGAFVVGKGLVWELVFYVAMGVVWIPGAALIIRWMSKPDDEPLQH
jgi:hypothetical protein